MKSLRWLAVVLLLSAAPQAAAEDLFEIRPVVEGVYAAIAKPQYKVNSNAAIILLDDGVLVVDTHSKPSAARALQQQIAKLTDKPVRFVVDTHFHWDHYQGNQAYLDTWPKEVEIISSEATRESIEHRGIPRIKHEILAVPKEIDDLKTQVAKATDANEKAQLQGNLKQAEDYLEELKVMRVALPSITFDRSLILHRKSRTVQILWLGKAHTDGDVFVYLPKEKFIATGDALQGWIPYMGDSYPYDWIKTLELVEGLDFDYTVGGHGDVLRGKEQFDHWRNYLSDLMDETAAAYAAGASMAEAEKTVTEKLRAKYGPDFAADEKSAAAIRKHSGPKADDGFTGSVKGNVQKAYRVVSGATE